MTNRDEEAETLRARLAFKRQEHQDLDSAIEALMHRAPTDEMTLRRLKKKKLALKDQIRTLETQLFPDIIA